MDFIKQRDADDQKAQQVRLERLEKKKQTEEWKANEKEMRKEVLQDVENRPDLAAAAFIRDGILNGQKIGKSILETTKLTREQKDSLPKSAYGRGGLDPDSVAQMFGFQTGAQLVERISIIEAMRGDTPYKRYLDQIVSAEVNRRMLERYGDLGENIIEAARE